MVAPPLATMRAQFNAVLADWGAVCDVQRFTPTKDATGRQSGTWVGLVSGGVDETIWIQAVGGESAIGAAGLNAETTHIAYQAYTGVSLQPKDRLIPSGAEFVFDVIRSYTRETHRESEVKQVRRM